MYSHDTVWYVWPQQENERFFKIFYNTRFETVEHLSCISTSPHRNEVEGLPGDPGKHYNCGKLSHVSNGERKPPEKQSQFDDAVCSCCIWNKPAKVPSIHLHASRKRLNTQEEKNSLAQLTCSHLAIVRCYQLENIASVLCRSVMETWLVLFVTWLETCVVVVKHWSFCRRWDL